MPGHSVRDDICIALPFDVHVARVPVAGFGHALRSPVSPDSELRVAIPLRASKSAGNPMPARLAGSSEIWNWGSEWYIVPRSSGNLERRGIVVPRGGGHGDSSSFVSQSCHRSPYRRLSQAASQNSAWSRVWPAKPSGPSDWPEGVISARDGNASCRGYRE